MNVERINDTIAQASGLNADKMRLFGLADPIIIRDNNNMNVQIPVVIEANGECHDVLLDDEFDMSLFHRLNKKSYTTITTEGYGNAPKRVCVHDMSLFVSGKRTAIDLYRLEQICVAAIESACEGVKNASSVVVESDFNRIRIFTSEWSNVEFPLQPDIFLFKINYKLSWVQSPC